jgi:hypothetical protein
MQPWLLQLRPSALMLLLLLHQMVCWLLLQLRLCLHQQLSRPGLWLLPAGQC